MDNVCFCSGKEIDLVKNGLIPKFSMGDCDPYSVNRWNRTCKSIITKTETIDIHCNLFRTVPGIGVGAVHVS